MDEESRPCRESGETVQQRMEDLGSALSRTGQGTVYTLTIIGQIEGHQVLPETKFEDGIKKTIQWYLDNREWWETIISGEYQNYYEKMYGNR